MAKTLLNSVNEILTRAGVIAGDAGELASLTDSARQNYIDVAVQVVNEGIDELYSSTPYPLPKELKEGTVTMATGDRSYALASDIVQMRFPLIDKTNNQYIHEFPGGYQGMLILDPEQDDEGLPLYGVVSPVDGELFLDRAPDASLNGRVYTYQYDKDLVLSVAADTVPFTDAVFRAMVPAWVNLWKRDQRNSFDAALFKGQIGRAARLLPQRPMRSSWRNR